MIEKHLEAIRSKEEEARKRIREAEGRAGEIVDEAAGAGERRLEEIRVEAAELERSQLAGAREKAGETIASLRAENAKKMAALGVTAKRNKERTLDQIIEAFKKEM